jgi:hypothetical protein
MMIPSSLDYFTDRDWKQSGSPGGRFKDIHYPPGDVNSRGRLCLARSGDACCRGLHPGHFSAKLEQMNEIMTTKEMVKGARKALEASRRSPREHIAHLIELGWIDTRGRVTKLLGGTAEPAASSKARNGRHARS